MDQDVWRPAVEIPPRRWDLLCLDVYQGDARGAGRDRILCSDGGVGADTRS